MPNPPPAPVHECLRGTVDGLKALIWRRTDDLDPQTHMPTLWWCWLSEGGEMLRTETHYVGWIHYKGTEVTGLTWRRLNPWRKVVIVNDREYPWPVADDGRDIRRGGEAGGTS